MVVATTIVPIPRGVTDAKHVCVLTTAMPPGVMALKVIIMIIILLIIMIITLWNMERIHGVIPIGETGNAIPSFEKKVGMLVVLPIGSVLADRLAKPICRDILVVRVLLRS